MEYVVALIVLTIVGLSYFMFRIGKKASKGEDHASHMEGDQTAHSRGEEFDAADPFGDGMSEPDDQ